MAADSRIVCSSQGLSPHGDVFVIVVHSLNPSYTCFCIAAFSDASDSVRNPGDATRVVCKTAEGGPVNMPMPAGADM